MKDLGRLPRSECCRVEKDVAALGVIVGMVILVLIALTVYVAIFTGKFYRDHYDACLRNGYGQYYCQKTL